MKSGRTIVIIAAITASGSLVLVAWMRHAGAVGDAQAARTHLASVTDNTRELMRLRMEATRSLTAAPPDQALVTSVRRSLANAGLPDIRLTQMSRPADRALRSASTGNDGPDVRTRTEVVVLDPVTLPELGRWISLWRDSHPLWVVSQIDLRAATGRPGSYSAMIHLATVYVRSAEPEYGS